MPENQNSERIPEELTEQKPNCPEETAAEMPAAAIPASESQSSESESLPMGSETEKTEESSDPQSAPEENGKESEAETAETAKEESTAESAEEPAAETAESEDVPEEMEAESAPGPEKKERSAFGFIARIALILLAICGAVTLLLATVNYITKDRIAENKAEEMNLAIREIFPDCDSSEPIDAEVDAAVGGIYQVKKGDQAIGYAVSVISSGFGGDIEMLVGIGAGGKIAGVQILSLSETPGVGSRVNDPDYLSGYCGKSGALVLKQDVDAVSGATISSRAVLAGVNAALGAKLDYSVITGSTDHSDETSDDVLDPEREFPADPNLETGKIEGEIPSLEFETMFREETKAPETQEDETELVEFVTRIVEDTEPTAETTGTAETTAPDETTEPVSTDDVPETSEPAEDEAAEPTDSDADA